MTISFKPLLILMIYILFFSKISAATIIGISPNLIGDTKIDQDTIWENESIHVDGNLNIGNSQKSIMFILKNSRVIIKDDILIGDGSTTFPVNFTIYNSTILWDSKESELILNTIPDNIGTRGHILNISYSNITTTTVNYLETDPTTRALGLYLKSRQKNPYQDKVHRNTIKISTSTISNMGRAGLRHPSTSKWISGDYGAISISSFDGTVGFNYTDDSYIKDMIFKNNEMSILDTYTIYQGFNQGIRNRDRLNSFDF